VLDEELALRHKVAERYASLFTGSNPNIPSQVQKFVPPSVQLPYIEPYNTSAWAQYTLLTPNRDAAVEKLKQACIPSAIHYPIPLNRQPAVADKYVNLPVGDATAEQVISLPMHHI
jgi:UDP-2-acetamido-2-deoxy-ribo-hexuluronate aminotransferase